MSGGYSVGEVEKVEVVEVVELKGAVHLRKEGEKAIVIDFLEIL